MPKPKPAYSDPAPPGPPGGRVAPGTVGGWAVGNVFPGGVPRYGFMAGCGVGGGSIPGRGAVMGPAGC